MLLITLTSPASAWDAYGGDQGGSKFSPLDQINQANVTHLTQAWLYQSGETGEGYANGSALTFEATPVFWQDTLFFNSSFGKAYAVDAATGAERWRFDAGYSKTERFDETAARGVSLRHGDQPGSQCNHRILFGTLRGHLHALDALTGRPCSDFGAVAEHKFRAIDLLTGHELWQGDLPRAGMASPMTYTSHGSQYVVIAAGGHGQLTDQTGDYLVAFALPDQVMDSAVPDPISNQTAPLRPR